MHQLDQNTGEVVIFHSHGRGTRTRMALVMSVTQRETGTMTVCKMDGITVSSLPTPISSTLMMMLMVSNARPVQCYQHLT